MWIQIPGAFVSIVNSHDDPEGEVVVRARARKHLERFLRNEELQYKHLIHEDKAGIRDYQFRAYLPKFVCSALVKSWVERMDYTNFKDASKEVDPDVTEMFEGWWNDHYTFQENRRRK